MSSKKSYSFSWTMFLKTYIFKFCQSGITEINFVHTVHWRNGFQMSCCFDLLQDVVWWLFKQLGLVDICLETSNEIDWKIFGNALAHFFKFYYQVIISASLTNKNNQLNIKLEVELFYTLKKCEMVKN